MEMITDWVSEHPKSAILICLILGAIFMWLAWCAIPEEFRNVCETCGTGDECTYDSETGWCVGGCSTEGYTCEEIGEGICECSDGGW